MKTTYNQLAQTLLLILLQVEVFLGRDQLVFKRNPNEELGLISLRIHGQNGMPFENDIFRKLGRIGKEAEECQNPLSKYNTLLNSQAGEENIHGAEAKLAISVEKVLQGFSVVQMPGRFPLDMSCFNQPRETKSLVDI
ncbi:MAG: hypothetical protein HXS52_00795 [Theionarchaea archaeon]|nr:hypothetical protein [Theionarchaea archaeon]